MSGDQGLGVRWLELQDLFRPHEDELELLVIIAVQTPVRNELEVPRLKEVDPLITEPRSR